MKRHIWLILFIFCSNICYAQYKFEKGDAIYRRGSIVGSWLLGHAGIYCDWVNTGTPSEPDNYNNHKVVQSMGREGVREITFQSFYTAEPFWSVRTKNLTAEQRRTIVNTARAQGPARYSFFWGYKRPGSSFRCDGFVEYCYEQAGVDII